MKIKSKQQYKFCNNLIKLETKENQEGVDIQIEGDPNDVLNILSHAIAVVFNECMDAKNYLAASALLLDNIAGNLAELGEEK